MLTCQGGPGFPDLTFAGRHRVLFAELKRLWRHEIVPGDWGTRSAEQEGWADRLGDRCVLWTPLDLLHIPEDLRRLNISF
jgi:hypothetical protein